MKKCSDCNVEMIDNCRVDGQHAFEIGEDGRSDLFLKISTGEKSSFIGIPFDVMNNYKIKARVCPKCGKVEMYVNLQEKI